MIDVIIVGAGPVGLLAAVALTDYGLRVEILDRGDGPSEHSKAIAIHARTLELLAAHGDVQRSFLDSGRKVFGGSAFSDGRRVAHLTLDTLDSPFPFVLSLRQRDTERQLVAAAEARGVSVRWGTECKGLTHDDDGVSVELSDGSTLRAKYAIGADGATSTVRKELDIPYEGNRYDDWFLLADADVEWSWPADEGYVFLHEDGPLALLPLPGGKWRIVGPLAGGGEDGRPPETEELVRAVVAERVHVDVSLDGFEWISTFRIRRRMAQRYRQGRVFLTGDAAHTHSPVGGRGMNTGFQDVLNLVWKLALVARGHGSQLLLDSYEAERVPIGRLTLMQTHFATEAGTMRLRLAHGLRDQLVGFFSSLGFVQTRLQRGITMLDVGYDASPITDQWHGSLWRTPMVPDHGSEFPSVRQWIDFGRGPSPGHRIPFIPALEDALDARRIFYDRRHVLLLFDGQAATEGGYETFATVIEEVRRRKLDELVRVMVVIPAAEGPPIFEESQVLYDPELVLHEAYGAGSEAIYLVRPDGHVAWRSQPASAERLFEFLSSRYGW